MTFKISKKNSLLLICVASVLLLVGVLVFWGTKVSADPERVFWKTVERSLATRGVTISSEQTANGTTAKQAIRYSLGAANLSHSVTTLSQQGTTVQNEMIGTPTVDHSRYLNIKTDQKKADGSAMDFTKVLGVWARGEEGTGQFFAQTVFGGSLPIGGMGVPIGNVAPDARAALVQQIRDDAVYQIAFGKTKKERVDGRLLYTYDVSVQPVGYVTLMKSYAQLLGLHGLDELDPKTYVGQQPFKLQMTVDAHAHQVVRITAPDTGSTQSYTGHDVPVQISPPEKTITGTELQRLLSEIQ